MKKTQSEVVKKSIMYLFAGMAAWMVVQELPAMVRYYKMKRL